jgi:hypothetical protein
MFHVLLEIHLCRTYGCHLSHLMAPAMQWHFGMLIVTQQSGSVASAWIMFWIGSYSSMTFCRSARFYPILTLDSIHLTNNCFVFDPFTNLTTAPTLFPSSNRHSLQILGEREGEGSIRITHDDFTSNRTGINMEK